MSYLLLDCLFLGVVTGTVVYMLRKTDGPYDVFKRLRMVFGVLYHPVLDEKGKTVDEIEEVPNQLAVLITCPWCSSAWISIPFIAYYVVKYQVPLFFVVYMWFAVIGVSALFNTIVDALNE
jgi:hypothetical protein